MEKSKNDTAVSSMQEMLKDFLFEMQEKSAKNGVSGISSGFTPLDNLTGGFKNGKVHVVGGRACMGRDEFMLSMIEKITMESKLPVLLFSTKKEKQEYISRLLSMQFNIPTFNMDEGCLEHHEWAKLDKGIRFLENAPLFIHDSLGLPLRELKETTQECIREKGIKIIFIDHLQMIDFENNEESRSERIAHVMFSLKQLAIQENVPVVVGSMLDKNPDIEEDEYCRRPELSNLPDSRFIEELADVVMFAHRPEYYHIYCDEHGNDLHGLLQIIVRKNALKPVGEVGLYYEKETGEISVMEGWRANTSRPFERDDSEMELPLFDA